MTPAQIEAMESAARKRRDVTLRDYFAGQAMQALLTKQGPYGEDMPKPYKDDGVMHCQELAEYAFIQADAMLKARAS